MAPRRRGPRGRPTQVSRMAAAVEAMAEMGFEPKLVRQKVNRLLKDDLYGDEGWRFIEESSYSVLLDALLEDETSGDDNENASLSKDGNHVETTGAGPSSSKVLLPCSNLEAVNITLQSKDDLDPASHNEALNNSPPTELPDASNFLPTVVETQGQEGTPVTHSAQQVDTLPTRRRRPYYGWVGCEDDDFVVLTEAPLPGVLRKMFIPNVDSGKRKRKSRWDVQPQDM
uniref:uncharacterized protein LOC101297485 isoform X2 n=1 Tax=Fragaria vesca subsp. vesca TaxID=101020 RepID=UPI0005C9C4E6|nr:PREDICTED: uncharacterized protein LOC101297485 isoform X2 [Fragaria vesca subsp. vesca]